MVAPRQTNQVLATPIAAQRSQRRDEIRVLTSGDAGKVLPVAFVPMLREDAVQRGQVRVAIQMGETAETLLNAVHVNVYAHFVPFLAFERFSGMDSLNRAYMGEPERPGETPVKYIHSLPYVNNTANYHFYKTAGLHFPKNTPVNSAYLEAYNTLVNFRRRQRSESLPQRSVYTTTLARAFWHHTHLRHIVPDFDQARIEGEVPLNVVAGLLPVKGIGVEAGKAVTTHTVQYSDGTTETGSFFNSSTAPGRIKQDPARPGFPAIFAELAQNGITVSLANIEMAKKTAAFARLREQYEGYDDEYLVDLLMQGVRVPEAAMSQPILLAHRHNIMGYSKRYATDAANLDKSVTQGETAVDLTFRTPPMNTGGVVVITAEIVPEQLFERQQDYFLAATDAQRDFPNYLRDFLDPEKVAAVPNAHVDISHTDPSGLFGYAPLNHQWQRSAPRIGGKFHRPVTDGTFDEVRQRLWSVETANPTLSEDFYLCTNLNKKVFSDQLADSFEIMATGGALISGLTVFGAGLTEASNDYERVLAEVDQTRIVKPA